MDTATLDEPRPAADGRGPTASGLFWGRLRGLVRAARPRQWIKNLACFAGLIFSGQLFVTEAIWGALLAFAGFSLAASCIYLINDVCDRKIDRGNPRTRTRPIASGLVPPSWALASAALLALAALALTLPLPTICWMILASYLVMNLAYSVRLKNAVLVDVLIIAIGFVLRVVHGVYAVEVRPSPWIVLCMFSLALFLGFAKRRAELGRVGSNEQGDHARPVLAWYRVEFLDRCLVMTATMAVLCYALYTINGRSGDATMVITVPIVFYGILRYLLLVTVHGSGESPERQIFVDRVSMAIVLLWTALCVAILYAGVHIEFEL
ncbi:decaprenyl-phosphate phosphoribosyltransferase [soil metagenome]